mgnify:CR=1 FL=1
MRSLVHSCHPLPGCKPTYEGLKCKSGSQIPQGIRRCKPTYEGLKFAAALVCAMERSWLQAYL